MKRGQTTPNGRHAGKTLAVRMLIARVAWLDWPMHWVDGRVCWTDGAHTITASAADLSSAARCLGKFPNYPVASRVVLGDVDTWLAEKHRRLNIVRELKNVRAPEVRAHPDPSMVAELCLALIVEATAVNAPPVRPSVELHRIGPAAIPALNDLIQRADLGRRVQLLAALVAGASGREATEARSPVIFTVDDPIAASYQYGAIHGLPTDINQTVTLLEVPDGFVLAERFETVRKAGGTFAPSHREIKRFFAELAPHTIVDLLEAIHEAGSLVGVLRNYYPAISTLTGCCGNKRLAQYLDYLDKSANLAIEDIRKMLADATARKLPPHGIRLLTSMLKAAILTANKEPDRWAYINRSIGCLRNALLTTAGLPEELVAGALRMLAKPVGESPRYLDGNLRNIFCRLLDNSRCLQVIERAEKFGLLETLSDCYWSEPESYKFTLDLAISLVGPSDLPKPAAVAKEILKLADCEVSLKHTKHALVQFAQRMSRLPVEHRVTIVQSVRSEFWESDIDLRRYLEIVGRHLDLFLTPEWPAFANLLIRIAVFFAQRCPQAAYTETRWAQSLLANADGRCYGNVDLALQIAFLGEVDARLFREILTAAVNRTVDVVNDVGGAITFLRRHHTLALAITSAYARHPQRCLAMMRDLAAITKTNIDFDWSVYLELVKHEPAVATGIEPQIDFQMTQSGREGFITIREYLTGIQAQEDTVEIDGNEDNVPTVVASSCVRIDTGLITLSTDSGWYRVSVLFPRTARLAAEYLQAEAISGHDLRLPKSLAKLVDTRKRAIREIEHLESIVAKDESRKDLSKRITNLRESIDTFEDHSAQRETAACEILAELLPEARLSAIEAILNGIYRRRLRDIVGPALDGQIPVEINSDLRNAIAMASSERENRKLFLKIIKHHVERDAKWLARHPKNAEFLENLEKSGIDADLWQSEFPRRYRCVDVDGGWVHLRAETDPIRILQMGNYFGTCLSLGGINAYTTAANACELNKRVIFAYDPNGRAVARKLIGLTAENKLAGFHTYTNNSQGRSSKTLEERVDLYARTFADACRIDLVDEGEIPTLFAERWYNDGCASWGKSDIHPVEAKLISGRDLQSVTCAS